MLKVKRILPKNIPLLGINDILNQLNSIDGIHCTLNNTNPEQLELNIEIESSDINQILQLGIILGMLEYRNQK